MSVALLAMAVSGASADTGNDLYQKCGNGFTAGFLNRGECHGYITGVANGLASTHAICFGPGVTDTQVVMVVQEYMKAHPELLNQNATSIIGQALTSAFPCS
jgi:Rap1a immunity proteins